MPRAEAKNKEKIECDYCLQRKGRNWMIVHHLKFNSEGALREHLEATGGEDHKKNGWNDSIVYHYRSTHGRFAGQAKVENKPVWQCYLESHGVKVKIKPIPLNARPLPF